MIKKAQLSEPTSDFWNDVVLQNADYLRYLTAHKKNIAAAGIKAGLNPINIIAHDWSKFKPKSFDTYEDFFFGPKGIRSGKVDPTVLKAFKEEFTKHYLTESHHNHKLGLPEDIQTQTEAVVDWYATSKAKADLKNEYFPTFIEWWNQNKFLLLTRGTITKDVFDKIEAAVKNNYNIFTYSIDRIKEFIKNL